MNEPNTERTRILTDLSGLAASLIGGGIRKGQPDLVLIGRVLNSLVDRIDRPETAKLAKEFLRQLQESGSVEREIKDLLSDLGIGQE
jgi:hypothetical protein